MTNFANSTVGILFKGNADDYKRASKTVRDETRGLQTDMAGLLKTLKGVGAGFLTLQAAQEALRLANLGEDLEETRNGFNNIVGNGPQNLARARSAVKGTVDDLRLMRLAAEAVQGGLNFDQVLQILEYAEYRAGQFGESFDTVFTQVSQNLQLMARGVAVSDRSLNKLQLTGDSVAEVMSKMADQMAKAEASGNVSSNTMSRFNANLENMKLLGAQLINATLGPLAAAFNFVSATVQQGLDPNRLRQSLSVLQSASAQPLTINRTGASNADLAQLLSQLEPDKAAAMFDILKANAELASENVTQLLKNLLEVNSIQIEAAKLNGKTETDYKDLLIERKRIQDQLATQETKAAELAKQQADSEKNAIRERIDQERALLEAKITNGQASYADFKALLDRQYADNKAFIDSDLAAQIAYISARGRIRVNEQAQRQQAESEIYNSTKRFVDYTLTDSNRSKTQRLADAYEIYRQTLSLENLSIDHRRQIVSEMAQLETELTTIITDESARRVELLNNLFGGVFLQAFDDILDGSAKRFEDYLGELGKALARFLASQLLLKFFALLAGGPLAGLLGGAIGGAGGIVGGGIGGGGGILSMPHTDPNSLLRGGMNAIDAFRSVSPVFNPTIQTNMNEAPIIIENHIDDLGIYTKVRRGERLYKRSDLSGS